MNTLILLGVLILFFVIVLIVNRSVFYTTNSNWLSFRVLVHESYWGVQVVEGLLIRIMWLYGEPVTKIISLIEVFQARALTVFLTYSFTWSWITNSWSTITNFWSTMGQSLLNHDWRQYFWETDTISWHRGIYTDIPIHTWHISIQFWT